MKRKRNYVNMVPRKSFKPKEVDFLQLKQVETFLTVAETGSFTKAGEKLFISSSAVAQQIGSLEADIGRSAASKQTSVPGCFTEPPTGSA